MRSGPPSSYIQVTLIVCEALFGTQVTRTQMQVIFVVFTHTVSIEYVDTHEQTQRQAPDLLLLLSSMYVRVLCVYHVYSHDEQATRFSALSLNSIECNCHSTGRVLSYYLSFLFFRVPPTK